MTLLSLLETSKQYGDRILLQNVNLSINQGEKIALIGKNGSGKSTLLKIIEDSIKQDSGQRIIKNNLEIASLPQQIHFPSNHTVKQTIEASLYHLKNAHTRFMQIAHTQDFVHNKTLQKEYNTLHSYIEQHDAWDLDSKIRFIMQSFDIEKYQNRLSISLSGGEQKRVALACILLKNADIIILDEPTNHLDVNMMESLEHSLKNIKSSVIFISHDRYFIDTIATRIIELDNASLMNFTQINTSEGAYLGYLQAKQQMLHNLQKEQEALKKILKNEELWLQRGVQARRKRNEGRKERLLELRAKVKAMPSSLRSITQTLEKTLNEIPKKSPKNTKKILFELQDFTLKVANLTLIAHLNLTISQGEKIGIVGKNGSGKSTLLKMLLGDYNLLNTNQNKEINAHTLHDSLSSNTHKNVYAEIEGKLIKAQMLIGYFDQHKNMLDDSKTLIETFCPNGGDLIQVNGKNIHVYGYLKSFLFPQGELEKKIGLLSGGEKSRVALALLFTKEYDCLILDEPTNDLDIATMNILEQHLQQYKGAVIFVSHDRYFTDKIAQRLLVLNHVDSTESHPAHFITHAAYSEVLEKLKELNSIKNVKPALMQHHAACTNSTSPNPTETTKIFPKKTQNKKLSYKDQLEYDNIESQIEKLESLISEIEYKLTLPEEYQKYGIETLSKQLSSTKADLESKWKRFGELCEKLSTL